MTLRAVEKVERNIQVDVNLKPEGPVRASASDVPRLETRVREAFEDPDHRRNDDLHRVALQKRLDQHSRTREHSMPFTHLEHSPSLPPLQPQTLLPQFGL